MIEYCWTLSRRILAATGIITVSDTMYPACWQNGEKCVQWLEVVCNCESVMLHLIGQTLASWIRVSIATPLVCQRSQHERNTVITHRPSRGTVEGRRNDSRAPMYIGTGAGLMILPHSIYSDLQPSARVQDTERSDSFVPFKDHFDARCSEERARRLIAAFMASLAISISLCQSSFS